MFNINFKRIDEILQAPAKNKKNSKKKRLHPQFKAPQKKRKPRCERLMEEICRTIKLNDDGVLIKTNKISKKSGYKGDPRILSASHKKAYENRKKWPFRFLLWFCEQEKTKWTGKEKKIFNSRMIYFNRNKHKWKGWGHFSMEFPHKSGVKCITYKRKYFKHIKFK